MRVSFLALLCVVLLALQVESKTISGSVEEGRFFIDIGSFFYAKGEGRFDYMVKGMEPEVREKAYIAMFDDESDSWDAAKNAPICNDVLQYARARFSLRNEVNKKNVIVRDHVIPRMWHIAIVVCNSPTNVPISFDYHFEFHNPGGHFEKEFPAPLGNITILFIIVFILLIPIGLFTLSMSLVSIALKTVKLHNAVFLLAFCVFFLYNLLLMIEGSVYANDGIGSPSVRGLTDLLFHFVDICLATVFLLLALSETPKVRKGQEDSFIDIGYDKETDKEDYEGIDEASILIKQMQKYRKLFEKKGKHAVFGTLLFFTIVQINSFVIVNISAESGAGYYVYDNVGGFVCMLLRLVSYLCVLLFALMSWLVAKDKVTRIYLISLIVVAFFWFIILPLIVVIGDIIVPYDRVYFVLITYNIILLPYLLLIKGISIPYREIIGAILHISEGNNPWLDSWLMKVIRKARGFDVEENEDYQPRGPQSPGSIEYDEDI